jgi:PST family polysaccharide transporter
MFFLAILNGEKDFRLYIRLSIVNSLISAIISIVLIWLYNISGALYALLIGQAFSIFVTIWAIRNKSWFKMFHLFEPLPLPFIRKLGGFALMALISAFVVPLGQIFVRSEIISVTSLNNAGIWDSVNRISGMLNMFVITTLSTYYMPRLSEISRVDLLRKEVWNTLRIVLPFLLFSVVLIYVFRYQVISLLYSKSFYRATDFFAYQILGDVFKLVSWLFAMVTIAKAKIKYFLVLELSFMVYYVLFSKYYIYTFGLEGAFKAYVLTHALNCALSMLIFFQMLKDDKTSGRSE